MLSKKEMKKISYCSLVALTLGSLVTQTLVGISAEASEFDSPIEELSSTDNNLDYVESDSNVITPFSVPSQGGTGGGGYSQVFHQYGSSKNYQATKQWLVGVFVGKGLSYIPNLGSFAAGVIGTTITFGLTKTSTVYYKVSTYITKTSNRGRQVRATIITYSDSARTKVLSTNTKLTYEF